MTSLPGELNGKSKLKREEVLQIYRMAWSGGLTQAQIASVWGISRETVSYIKLGKMWRWLTQAKETR